MNRLNSRSREASNVEIRYLIYHDAKPSKAAVVDEKNKAGGKE